VLAQNPASGRVLPGSAEARAMHCGRARQDGTPSSPKVSIVRFRPSTSETCAAGSP
jgi:hypothetical protein